MYNTKSNRKLALADIEKKLKYIVLNKILVLSSFQVVTANYL